MPIKYQKAYFAEEKDGMVAYADMLEYDELQIHRSGSELKMDFFLCGKKLFEQSVFLTGEGEVFKISGLQGKVKIEIQA